MMTNDYTSNFSGDDDELIDCACGCGDCSTCSVYCGEDGLRCPDGRCLGESRSTPEHVSYPHQPGRLYDCPACEAECFCGDRTPPGNNPPCCNLAACLPGSCHTECVYCATMAEPYDPANYMSPSDDRCGCSNPYCQV